MSNTPYGMSGYSENNIRILGKIIRGYSFPNIAPIKDRYIRTGSLYLYVDSREVL